MIFPRWLSGVPSHRFGSAVYVLTSVIDGFTTYCFTTHHPSDRKKNSVQNIITSQQVDTYNFLNYTHRTLIWYKSSSLLLILCLSILKLLSWTTLQSLETHKEELASHAWNSVQLPLRLYYLVSKPCANRWKHTQYKFWCGADKKKEYMDGIEWWDVLFNHTHHYSRVFY